MPHDRHYLFGDELGIMIKIPKKEVGFTGRCNYNIAKIELQPLQNNE